MCLVLAEHFTHVISLGSSQIEAERRRAFSRSHSKLLQGRSSKPDPGTDLLSTVLL